MTDTAPVAEAILPTVNLFGLDRTALRALFAERGEKPFRADQVMQWIYRRGLDDFDGMTNVAKDLRERMKTWFSIQTPELIAEQTSTDGTRKWVLRLDGGNAVETVYIPEDNRGTLCISSQVGCAMDCSFCSTGKQGFNRNMTAADHRPSLVRRPRAGQRLPERARHQQRGVHGHG